LFTFVTPDNIDARQQQAPRTPASKRGRRQLDDHGRQQAELEAGRPRVKHHIEPGIAEQQRSQHHQTDDQHLPAAPGRPGGGREGGQLREVEPNPRPPPAV
jgi:hypothetical protein